MYVYVCIMCVCITHMHGVGKIIRYRCDTNASNSPAALSQVALPLDVMKNEISFLTTQPVFDDHNSFINLAPRREQSSRNECFSNIKSSQHQRSTLYTSWLISL